MKIKIISKKQKLSVIRNFVKKFYADMEEKERKLGQATVPSFLMTENFMKNIKKSNKLINEKYELITRKCA